jgi:hypothetical protein
MGRFAAQGPGGAASLQGLKGGHGHTRTLRKPPCHFAWSPYAGLTARTHSPILIQKNSVVCTENSVVCSENLIDYVTELPNVNGDDPCPYRKLKTADRDRESADTRCR